MIMPLCFLNRGDNFRVEVIKGSDDFVTRFNDIGVKKDNVLKVVDNSSKTITVFSNKYKIIINKNICKHILGEVGENNKRLIK